jgi:cyclopropane-fatty-acyl-phospholipid synthase
MNLIDSGLLPDFLLRFGIRRLVNQRLRDERAGGLEAIQQRFRDLLRTMNQGPVAVATQDANEQHYEVPPAFFEQVLGPRLKYSCALWDAGTTTLAQAEEAMLALTCERAELRDGQRILELGCGWGSLTLWMAQHYPSAHITAVSNSRDQRSFILERAQALGLRNLEVITADMNVFTPPASGYDRVVSVEMFEHMRNHRELLRRIATWLAPSGRLFVHIFTHREFTYFFEAKDASDWMAREFFTGGVMPSDHLLLYHQEHLRLVDHWRMSGTHYEKTAEAWLANQDQHREALLALFARVYGADQARLRFERWRLFFLACAELWGFRGGEEWFVSHYLFERATKE